MLALNKLAQYTDPLLLDVSGLVVFPCAFLILVIIGFAYVGTYTFNSIDSSLQKMRIHEWVKNTGY
jgi:hypothetical protein